jgi:hypothetical protein
LLSSDELKTYDHSAYDIKVNIFCYLSYGHPDFNVLTSVLESESNVLINWFKVNKMEANPDKFQVFAVGKKTFDKNLKICLQNSTLSCEETVKLLGIEIDYQLNVDIHISSICRKASHSN